VLAGGQGGAQGDDGGVEDVLLERHLGALGQDVLQLRGVVRREDH